MTSLEPLAVMPVVLSRENTLANRIAEYKKVRLLGRPFNTLKNYNQAFLHLESWFADKPFTVENYAAWISYLERTHAPGGVRLIRNLVGAFLNYCELRGYIRKSPNKLVPPTKAAASVAPRKLITPEDYEALKKFTRGTHYYFAIVAGWWLGWRMSDIYLMLWDSVNMEECMVTIIQKKTGGPARMPFQPGGELEAELKKLWDARKDDWSAKFVSPFLCTEYFFDSRTSAKSMTRIFRAAGLERGKSFHSFRHLMGSRLANTNVSTALACQMTGHASPNIFKTYVHPDDDSMRKAMQAAMEWKPKKYEPKKIE